MLPFKPTGAQKRVLGEIAKDMAVPHPMYRLLQGDVGSGKTLVAAEAAIIAIENGYQVAVLAPTEILATQHYFYFKKLFHKLGYVTISLTGSNTAREKMQLKKIAAAGLAKVVVGTHAILESDVEFQKLGLAIVDEQHRFGVEQRQKLMEKGEHPDVLVMTATPIPRTLALTVYGDLDVSVIDEMPPGRKPIVTKHVEAEKGEQVYSFLKKQIDAGRQAYVVYPVIEESETQAMKAAQKMHQHLSGIVFPNARVGLLHGKLPQDEKEAAMEKFQRGETQILVSTTVIEVGVDVPNATVMVIEEAERFGLAQLHQLRGRVGRGAEQSYCILVTGKLGPASKERIRTLVDSNDGFHIAEVDMKLRGPGEFFGTKQSGLPALQIASIVRDPEILEIARNEAAGFVTHPPSLDDLHRAVGFLRDHWQRRYGLVLGRMRTDASHRGRIPQSRAEECAGIGHSADAGSSARDFVQRAGCASGRKSVRGSVRRDGSGRHRGTEPRRDAGGVRGAGSHGGARDSRQFEGAGDCGAGGGSRRAGERGARRKSTPRLCFSTRHTRWRESTERRWRSWEAPELVPEVVVVQHDKRLALAETYGGLKLARTLKQGDNVLSFYEPSPRNAAAARRRVVCPALLSLQRVLQQKHVHRDRRPPPRSTPAPPSPPLVRRRWAAEAALLRARGCRCADGIGQLHAD